LTREELNVLRLLQSPEAQDYSTGFYYNEYFESISVNYTCEQCDREMFDLASLRRHILARHSEQPINNRIAPYMASTFPPLRQAPLPTSNYQSSMGGSYHAKPAFTMANTVISGKNSNPIEID